MKDVKDIKEIGSELSKLKSFGIDRVILAVNAEKDYDVKLNLLRN